MKNQFLIKHFYKSKAIKLFLVLPSRKVKVIWAIPDNNQVTYNGNTFVINEKDFVLDNKNIPCYFVDTKNVEVKNPYSPDTINEVMTPEDFNTAISSKVATEIFNTMKGEMDKQTITIILLVVAIGVVGVVGYLLSGRIDELMALLQEIKEKLDLIGGF